MAKGKEIDPKNDNGEPQAPSYFTDIGKSGLIQVTGDTTIPFVIHKSPDVQGHIFLPTSPKRSTRTQDTSSVSIRIMKEPPKDSSHNAGLDVAGDMPSSFEPTPTNINTGSPDNPTNVSQSVQQEPTIGHIRQRRSAAAKDQELAAKNQQAQQLAEEKNNLQQALDKKSQELADKDTEHARQLQEAEKQMQQQLDKKDQELAAERKRNKELEDKITALAQQIESMKSDFQTQFNDLGRENKILQMIANNIALDDPDANFIKGRGYTGPLNLKNNQPGTPVAIVKQPPVTTKQGPAPDAAKDPLQTAIDLRSVLLKAKRGIAPLTDKDKRIILDGATPDELDALKKQGVSMEPNYTPEEISLMKTNVNKLSEGQKRWLAGKIDIGEAQALGLDHYKTGASPLTGVVKDVSATLTKIVDNVSAAMLNKADDQTPGKWRQGIAPGVIGAATAIGKVLTTVGLIAPGAAFVTGTAASSAGSLWRRKKDKETPMQLLNRYTPDLNKKGFLRIRKGWEYWRAGVETKIIGKAVGLDIARLKKLRKLEDDTGKIVIPQDLTEEKASQIVRDVLLYESAARAAESAGITAKWREKSRQEMAAARGTDGTKLLKAAEDIYNAKIQTKPNGLQEFQDELVARAEGKGDYWKAATGIAVWAGIKSSAVSAVGGYLIPWVVGGVKDVFSSTPKPSGIPTATAAPTHLVSQEPTGTLTSIHSPTPFVSPEPSPILQSNGVITSHFGPDLLYGKPNHSYDFTINGQVHHANTADLVIQGVKYPNGNPDVHSITGYAQGEVARAVGKLNPNLHITDAQGIYHPFNHQEAYAWSKFVNGNSPDAQKARDLVAGIAKCVTADNPHTGDFLLGNTATWSLSNLSGVIKQDTISPNLVSLLQ